MSAVNMSTMKLEEGVLKDTRRSRFSFHFNTMRRRRWVLVQMVSVPVDRENAQPDSSLQRAVEAQVAARPARVGNLLDEFCTNQMMKRWV